MAENFLDLSCTTEHAPGLQCSPSKRARLKDCLEEFDGRTPKLVRLDNEDEGTPSRFKRHARRRLQVTRSNCPYFNFLHHRILSHTIFRTWAE